MQATKMVEKRIFSDNAYLEPAQRADGKWVWQVVSFGFNAEIYDKENNHFALIKTEADSAIDLLIERKEL
jgi:hypothetical protein